MVPVIRSQVSYVREGLPFSFLKERIPRLKRNKLMLLLI